LKAVRRQDTSAAFLPVSQLQAGKNSHRRLQSERVLFHRFAYDFIGARNIPAQISIKADGFLFFALERESHVWRICGRRGTCALCLLEVGIDFIARKHAA
jgi:hypothetical protein